MCSFTWLRRREGYAVNFNRDELRSRPTAERPAWRERAGCGRWLGGRDPLRGGTWLALNDHGLMACVLNFYEKAVVYRRGKVSRGEIPPRAVEGRTTLEARARVEGLRASDFAPFHVALLGVGDRDPFFLGSWDGSEWRWRELEAAAPDPVTTSSFATGAVTGARKILWREWCEKNGGVDEALMDAYHSHRFRDGSAFSVCMERWDARTVSRTRVRMGLEGGWLGYAERDEAGEGFGAEYVVAFNRRG